MDTMTAMLDGPRARGAFMLRCLMDPPWSLRIQDEGAATVVVVARGVVWIVDDDAEPLRLDQGDLAVVTGPAPYTVADSPQTPPHIVIDPGEHCHTLTGEPLETVMGLGVRTWGNSRDGETVMLTGTYELASQVSGRLLEALPRVAVLRREEYDGALLPVLLAEIGRDDPGQEVVLDRLLDLMLVAAVREWFSRPGVEPPTWWLADGDDIVGPALRLLHNAPQQSWTVAGLAAAVGVSRATLARRFSRLVGEAPMTYLTRWRLALAADLLHDSAATLTAVARQVGYTNPFALSVAFKREYGVSPQAFRAAAG
jgi:AraC-like DNA-binding protein